MWNNNAFPHALLLTGAEGTGGLPMALAVAQYIFCEAKTPMGPCGACPGCGKVARLEHADLHLSFPSISHKPNVKPTSKLHIREFREFVRQSPYGTTYDWLQFINAENKQGNITADECREIIEKMYLRPYEGGKKVLIMWRPEYLGKEGNILLKIIEEPPADTIMIFVAEQRDEILQTIRSRTQEIRLVPLTASEIADALTQRQQMEPVQALQLAQIAQGSYTEALRLSRHTENDLFPHVRQMFSITLTNKGPEMVAFTEEWAKSGREQQKNLLYYVIQILEQVIRAQYAPNAPIPLPPAETAFVQRMAAANYPPAKMEDLIKAFTDTAYYIERNAHAKTQILALLIRMQHIMRRAA